MYGWIEVVEIRLFFVFHDNDDECDSPIETAGEWWTRTRLYFTNEFYKSKESRKKLCNYLPKPTNYSCTHRQSVWEYLLEFIHSFFELCNFRKLFRIWNEFQAFSYFIYFFFSIFIGVVDFDFCNIPYDSHRKALQFIQTSTTWCCALPHMS